MKDIKSLVVEHPCYGCERIQERDKYKADADRQNITIVNLTEDLLYIAGIVEKGTGKPLDKNIPVTKQVLDYVKSKEADAERLAELCKWADYKLGPELNPSNYTHDDVCELNSNVIEVGLAIRAALAAHEEGKNGFR